MKLFKNGEGKEYLQKVLKKNTKEDDDRKKLTMEGMMTILENGFLKDEEEEKEYIVQEGKISVRSEMFTFAQLNLEGNDEELLDELDKFYKKNIIKEGYLPGRKGELNYEPQALLDLTAFVLANRDFDSSEPVYIDCVFSGIEITCKAAKEGNRIPGYASMLMERSLKDTIEKCMEYKNGYPLIRYDEISGELTAAILVPPLFTNRKKTKEDEKSERDAASKAYREKRIKYLV